MKFIKQLSWLLRALLFIMIFAFALMNTDTVKLRFFLGRSWEAPMIVALLLFFVVGAAIGVLACLSRLLGQRREIQRLQRALRAGADRSPPPQA
ncbi:MAG TPA: lipopolysaccharide assembly protein LapA domain-containing protein [Burkholderiales bacterium]|nr:lipopolysaccharide assembly protein LapA domain-containing protein [Burkholderiales bacterium]